MIVIKEEEIVKEIMLNVRIRKRRKMREEEKKIEDCKKKIQMITIC